MRSLAVSPVRSCVAPRFAPLESFTDRLVHPQRADDRRQERRHQSTRGKRPVDNSATWRDQMAANSGRPPVRPPVCLLTRTRISFRFAYAGWTARLVLSLLLSLSSSSFSPLAHLWGNGGTFSQAYRVRQPSRLPCWLKAAKVGGRSGWKFPEGSFSWINFSWRRQLSEMILSGEMKGKRLRRAEVAFDNRSPFLRYRKSCILKNTSCFAMCSCEKEMNLAKRCWRKGEIVRPKSSSRDRNKKNL